MPIRREKLVKGEIYHIVLRGVADSLIFKDEADYYRGIFSLYEFNTTKAIEIAERRKARLKAKQINKDKGGPSSVADNSRDLLVDILAFCFMPNHIHLLLRQIKDDGISKFMSKFGTGYAGYFKHKYEQKGTGYFFQGRFVSVHIKTDKQLKIVFVYIHTNPISLIEPRWKEVGISNPEEVIKFLEDDYRWSSYPDYIGKRNFPSVTERDFILKVMDGEGICKKFVENWIRYKGEIRDFADLALE